MVKKYIKRKARNPVDVMDSVDALDLLSRALKAIRDRLAPDPSFLDLLREQIYRHRRALRRVIGAESL
jgi:hypothetical protein